MNLLSIEDIDTYCKNVFDIELHPKLLEILISTYLLPVFCSEGKNFILRDDLDSLLQICTYEYSENSNVFKNELFDDGILVNPYTKIINFNSHNIEANYTFFSAARNLASDVTLRIDNALTELKNISYFPPTRILTTSKKVHQYINAQKERFISVDQSNSSRFANSASYMGSKRSLRGFLVEAIYSVLPSNGVVLDLMCGSGAATGAFNKFWRTIASDSQEFCRLLAVVQGGGFTVVDAENILKHILPFTKSHISELRFKLSKFLDVEDQIFHGNISTALLQEYKELVMQVPTYPNGHPILNWDPVGEVEKRKTENTRTPYCLFTAYFANVYFGLRQCVEIDSLRFAIDQIKDESHRQWALGALIATISAAGTTYGGHFAQPLIKKTEDLNLHNLSRILDLRSRSIIHEFSVRLMNLAEESQKSNRSIEIVPGPWRNALLSVEVLLSKEPVLVYLDAPYKREEYSRYYHIHETLVSYSYPSSKGTGRTPDVLTGERFSSEFATKIESKTTQLIADIIIEILKRGWTCAWSYSDSGVVSIVSVINRVSEIVECDIKSYAVPYEHKPQGGNGLKKVTEYLVIIIPKK